MPVSQGDINADVLLDIARAIYAGRQTDKLALKNFSIAFKSAREAAIPFLFRSVAVRQDWNVDAVRALRELTVINPYVRTFTFAPDPLYEVKSGRVPRSAPLPTYDLEQISQCIALVADVLRGYNSLRTLVFQLKGGLFDPTHPEKALSMLQSSALQLPSVDSLSIEENAVSVFVGGICPRVTDLSVLDLGQLSLGRWAPTPSLTRLELRKFMWEYNDDDGLISKVIRENMPNIQSLTVDARLYSGNIESKLSIFYGLRNLQVLSITNIEDLGLGYYPPQCGFGWANMSEEEQADLEPAEAEALKRIKRITKGRFPRLKYLWLGSSMLFDFSQLKSNGVEAVDQLPPAWEAYEPDHKKKLAALVDAHPECERFHIRDIRRV